MSSVTTRDEGEASSTISSIHSNSGVPLLTSSEEAVAPFLSWFWKCVSFVNRAPRVWVSLAYHGFRTKIHRYCSVARVRTTSVQASGPLPSRLLTSLAPSAANANQKYEHAFHVRTQWPEPV
jgi:hypothetical protein